MNVLLQMDTAEPETFVLFVLAGVAYAFFGYAKEVAAGNGSIKPRKALSTVVIGAVAGVIMAFGGEELTGDGLDQAMVVAIPIIDMWYNRFVGERLGGDKETKSTGRT